MCYISLCTRADEGDFLTFLGSVCSESYRACPAPFAHDPCAVLATSGGEGEGREGEGGSGRPPKLAVHTHRNMVAYSKIFLPKTDSPRPMYFLNHPFGSARGHIAISLCNPITR